MKVALVTGCSSGIGLETAIKLAKAGYQTFASMRDTTKSAKLEQALKNKNLPVDIIKLDVNDTDSITLAINQILTKHQRIDVLVNNAGYGQFGCLEDLSVDDFRKQFETNFFSVISLIQKVAPIMREQKSGVIVNVSSVGGRMGLPGISAYISTKFALEGLSECLRYELGQFGIQTTLIEPGVVKTNFFNSMQIAQSNTDPKYKEITDNILAGLKMTVEMGTDPALVADTILEAINDSEIKPRYLIGADAAMFMDAKKSRSDIEFEKFVSKGLFPS